MSSVLDCQDGANDDGGCNERDEISFEGLLAGVAQTTSQRIKPSMTKGYKAHMNQFAAFVAQYVEGAPDPRHTRFAQLPECVVAFLEYKSRTFTYGCVENTKSGLVWYYDHGPLKEPGEKTTWEILQTPHGSMATGNPVHTKIVMEYMEGLRNEKKGDKTKRATPIKLAMLGELHAYIDSEQGQRRVSRPLAFWFKAVTSTAMYLFARMGEVFTLKRRDVVFGCVTDGVQHGTITLVERKTEESSGRKYHLYLQDDERPLDCMYHILAWLQYCRTVLGHDHDPSEPLFPQLYNVGRNGATASGTHDLSNVMVRSWARHMPEAAMGVVLNKIIALHTQCPSVTDAGRELWTATKYTCHTFRRAGAQHRLMSNGYKRKWTLSEVKWWGGWCNGAFTPHCCLL